VRIDYADGTRQAVRYLAGLGHREIGFIGFPGSEKYEAFWRALEELGLPYSPRFVQFLQVPDLAPSALSGYQCAARLLAAPKRPTALLVSNDYVAMGAIDAAGVAGVAVPEDLSVVGFDDLGQSGVQLTTVRVNLVEAGRVAAQALLDRLANPALPVRSLVLPVELVVRGSTAALPAAVAQAAE
jgi:LacI family transcriptional regulator